MTSGLNGCGSEDNERFTLGMAHCDPLSRDSNQMGSQDQPDPIALAQSDVCHLSAIRIGVGMDAEVSHAMDQPQVDDLKETGNMWISKAHYRLLTQHVDEARNDFDVRSSQFGATISAQQAQIQHLEEDRRELVRMLLVREERRTAPAIAVPDTTPPEGWEAIMRKQIEAQDADVQSNH